jgi:hypothetical protein
MTGTQFSQLIRKWTSTNSATLTDADLVVFANAVKDDLAELIVANVDEGYFNATDTRDLEAGVRNYTYPSDWLKSMRYISAKLDGVKTTTLDEVDFGFIAKHQMPLEESYIVDMFSNRRPAFYFSGNELNILSGSAIIAVTGGLTIVSEIYPEDLTTTHLSGSTDLSVASATTTCRLPRSAHMPWATLVSIAYKSSKDKPLPLTDNEKKVAVDLEEMYKKLRGRNAVREVTASVPYDDGQDY